MVIQSLFFPIHLLVHRIARVSVGPKQTKNYFFPLSFSDAPHAATRKSAQMPHKTPAFWPRSTSSMASCFTMNSRPLISPPDDHTGRGHCLHVRANRLSFTTSNYFMTWVFVDAI